MDTSNELLVDNATIQQVCRMFDPSRPGGILLEVGSACAHGWMYTWPRTDTTWVELHAFYLCFEGNTPLRKLTLRTFIECVMRTQKHFKLTSNALS